MWELLSDPQVLKTLGLLGSGIAAVVAAGWAVFKFVLSRPKSSIRITADRGGMAAGRDINAMSPPSTPKSRR